MTVKVYKILTSFFHALLITALVCGVTQTAFPIVFAQSGLVGVIDSDTTWTKADSPYNVTGPLLIKNGATLTIEAGTTVELNNYDVVINGTLRVIGNSNEKINVNGGNKIEFTQYSNGWNEHTSSGSVIENAIFSSCTISSSLPLKLDNNVFAEVHVGNLSSVTNNKIEGSITAGSSSELSDNEILGSVTSGSSTEIVDNEIGGGVSVQKSSIISNCKIGGSITAEDTIISSCNIGGFVNADKCTISNSEIRGGINGTSLVIKNNVVTVPESAPPNDDRAAVSIKGGTSVISDNTLTGGGNYYDLFSGPTAPIGSLDIRGGSAVISNNIINSSGILLASSGSFVIANNTISPGISCSYYIWQGGYREFRAKSLEMSGNLIIGGAEVNADKLVFSKNKLIGTGGQGLDFSVYSSEPAYIADNTISGCSMGIYGSGTDAIIENNLIANSTTGLKYNGTLLIQNNTIVNNEVGLYVYSSATIRYNNLENNIINIQLEETSESIDTTNNWWGTTDTQTINMTIRDYKFDFNLGKVTFTPFLTEPNPDAMPNSNPIIPEFSSLLVCPLLLGAALLVAVYKRKISKQTRNSPSC